jgi:signal transduction histidine kinase
MARNLRDVALRAAPAALVRDAAQDPSAAGRLFDTAAAVVADTEAGVAVTVYALEGTPLAWAGAPSELPRARLLDRESWFLSEGTSGLRLFYVRTIEEAGRPLGVAAAERIVPSATNVERPVASGLGGSAAGAFQFPTRLAPVTIEPVRAGEAPPQGALTVTTPAGDPLLTASVARDAVSAMRERWRQAVSSLSIAMLAVTVLLLAGPVLDWRRRRRPANYLLATLIITMVVVVSRLLVRLASPADWSAHPIFSGAAYASPLLAPLFASPFDFLATAVAAGGLAALGLIAVESWRVFGRPRRRPVLSAADRVKYLAAQTLAGITVAAIARGHESLLRDTVQHSTLDLLRFSLLHWDTARMALHAGLIVAHATALALMVTAMRAALVGWRVGRHDVWTRAAGMMAWALPLLAWLMWRGQPPGSTLTLLTPAAIAVAIAVATTRVAARFRHGSQAFRLGLLSLGLVAPTCASYPMMFGLAREARTELVETRYAPQAIRHRLTVQTQLEESLSQIDRLPGLESLVTPPRTSGDEEFTDRAFQAWLGTALSTYPVTSSVELYGPDGALVSRFAFNLPEDLTATPPSEERTCDWDVYEEVAPFFGEERRIIHAGRAICGPTPGRPLGSIAVHAMPDDYENLPFLTSRNPYVELLRPSDALRGGGLAERGVEYAVYGWSRRPIYVSGATAWELPDDVFARVERSRRSFWTELDRGSERHYVYLLNDRSGIYALGFPVVPPLGHLLNLAEVTLLAVGTGLLLLAAYALVRAAGGRTVQAPALLRHVRASFYRKLFVAFVAAAFVPVVLLAVATRNYIADRVRVNIEQEAVRTAAAAGRVVQNLVAPRGAQSARIEDNLLVFVSRLIDQDVNIFAAGRLLATSERNLFASGFLPTRTPAAIHHALEIRNDAAAVTHERIGTFEYLVAATPLTARQFTGVLTLPLPSRQQEIDAEIETLDRRVLLAALLFVCFGAGLGYSMAERISDPISRLSRATRRIARGDLSARTVATSADELGRLVVDFNSMAAELQRQRIALERTHRVEAWAEMARQVAHEIKNPLTPIQLNAEHLRRVHADSGEPLSPVLQECVATILTQVKLLRQIASEFSSFASSPTARPAPVDIGSLITETVEPYEAGLSGRVHMVRSIAPDLPPVFVDRTLIVRSLTNLVENALHAMPGGGTLTISAEPADGAVCVTVSDSGQGMDAEALARAFEPYFSTKSSGTGLGLPIARRNVELNGGTMSIASERERGTTVRMILPLAPHPVPAPAA